jgi:hypothetical protein
MKQELLFETGAGGFCQDLSSRFVNLRSGTGKRRCRRDGIESRSLSVSLTLQTPSVIHVSAATTIVPAREVRIVPREELVCMTAEIGRDAGNFI